MRQGHSILLVDIAASDIFEVSPNFSITSIVANERLKAKIYTTGSTINRASGRRRRTI